MRQRFNTTSVLRLEVQEPWPGLPNLVENHSGRDGAWGWGGPDQMTMVAGPRLRLTKTLVDGVAVAAYDVAIPAVVATGQQVRGWVRKQGGTSGRALSGAFQFLDASRTVITSTVPGAGTSTNGTTVAVAPATVPVGTHYLRFRVVSTASIFQTEFLEFDQVTMVTGSAAEVAATTTPTAEVPWVNVIGPSHEVNIDRAELNVGTLSAVVRDSALDPSQHDLIRPGRTIRAITTAGEVLFRGEILKGRATYDLRSKASDTKRTKIEVSAVDNLTELANTPRSEGVATIAELPYVLDGTGVAYVVNGSSSSIDPTLVTVVSVNENATAIDQVALTRDSSLGYAWLCRKGVVRAWDRDMIPTSVAATYDEDDYSDLDVDFDTERCINTVKIKIQSVDPVTGEGLEVSYGPWVDVQSVRTWGSRSAEFTVHGLDEADLDSYAAAILDANATPQVRINSVTMPLLTTARVNSIGLRDLYDLVTVSNTRAGRTQTARVVSVSHSITPTLWQTVLGFAAEGGVAPPQVIPAPGTSAGLTQAERLRPVGEVTMFYGSTSSVPAGWLVCDGSSFSGSTYPKLQALLGGTTLPNLVDRFPVGAGVKALGSSGGASTKTIAETNLPAHTHGVPMGAALGPSSGATRVAAGSATPAGTLTSTTGSGSGTPLDVMPPWRAVYFIIRAV